MTTQAVQFKYQRGRWFGEAKPVAERLRRLTVQLPRFETGGEMDGARTQSLQCGRSRPETKRPVGNGTLATFTELNPDMKTKWLLKARAAILAEPDQFVMSDFFSNQNALCRPVPNCGTAACIAGWMATLAKKRYRGMPAKARRYEGRRDQDYVWSRQAGATAQKLLGVDDRTARRLFLISEWPEEFRWAFNEAKTMKGKARVAARRIDHFIKTNGAE